MLTRGRSASEVAFRILSGVNAGEWRIASTGVSSVVVARGWRVTVKAWRLMADDSITSKQAATESRTMDIIGLPEVLGQWSDDAFDDRLLVEVGRLLSSGGSAVYFPLPEG